MPLVVHTYKYKHKYVFITAVRCQIFFRDHDAAKVLPKFCKNSQNKQFLNS